MRFLNMFLGLRRFTVAETERVIVSNKGKITDVLGPGEHNVRHDAELEVFSIAHPVITSFKVDTLFDTQPEFAAQHFEQVVPGPKEVAVITRRGAILEIVRSERSVTLFANVPHIAVGIIDVSETALVPARLQDAAMRSISRGDLREVSVAAGHVAVVQEVNRDPVILPPGRHIFFEVGEPLSVRQVDMRQRSLDVNGQEILTKDRVTLRVNVTATFRVTDPVAAVTQVQDFAEDLHLALQLAFRRTLGALTVDQLLTDKVSVDQAAADEVRSEMAKIGLEVGAIALKDVILPGEMREILNRVVEAEKEAEANVIRRREETNATRSLLNTAKVMAENPVMLRLKELEAIESIAEKVERLTIHNGTEGLMTDLVKLRD